MKKLVSFLITFSLCFSLCLTNVIPAYAKTENNLKEHEEAEASPRSIMHLSKEFKCDSAPIYITFVYAYQESTDSIIGLDRAYVSSYNQAQISEVRMSEYGVYSGFTGFYAYVWYTNRGTTSSKSALASWYF